VVVDAWKKDSLLRVSHVYHGVTRAFGLVPRAGSYGDIHDRAENIFDLTELERRKDAITKEAARVIIVNRSGNAELANRVKRYLTTDLGFTDVTLSGTGETIEKTEALDRTDGRKPFSFDELLKKVPATAVPTQSPGVTLPDSANTLFVILGTDLIDAYIYEEASIDELNNTPLDQQFLDVIER